MYATPERPTAMKRTASMLTPSATANYVKRLRTAGGALSRSQSIDILPSATTSRSATPAPAAPAFYGNPSEAPRLLAGPDEAGLALIRQSLEEAKPRGHAVIKRSASFYSASECSIDDPFPTYKPPADHWDSKPPVVSEASASKFLVPTGVAFDYTPPSAHSHGDPIPLTCTSADIVLFPRKNRIYGKNLSTSEAPSQLAKIPEKFGGLTLLAAATADHPHLFAAATAKNQIYIYDVNKPNDALLWFSAGAEVGAMAWSRTVLTVGDAKGRIRHYDTRITPATRMKEQARKLMRHQAKVTALGYHRLGNKLASGDAAGNVFVWDIRNQLIAPMDVGEFVQRRKKIQHDAPISAISWSPWDSQTFCTGDTAGIIRRWDVTDNTPRKSNVCFPRITDHKRRVDKIIYSPDHCRETLSVHTGPALDGALETRRHEAPSVERVDASNRDVGPWNAPPDRPDTSNAVVVHTGALRKYLGTVPVSATPLGACALASMGRKIVFAVPDTGKIEVWTCWGKQRAEPRRTLSMMLR